MPNCVAIFYPIFGVKYLNMALLEYRNTVEGKLGCVVSAWCHWVNNLDITIHPTELFFHITVTSLWATWRLKLLASRLFNHCPDADQRKHQGSASLAFVRGIHGWPVHSLHKGQVTRKRFPLNAVSMSSVSGIRSRKTRNLMRLMSLKPRAYFRYALVAIISFAKHN